MKRMDPVYTVAFLWGAGCAVLTMLAFLTMRSLTTGELRHHAGGGAFLLPVWFGVCVAVAISITKVRSLVTGPTTLLVGSTIVGVSYATATTPLAWYYCLLPQFVGIGLLLCTFFRGASPISLRLGALAVGYAYFASYPWNMRIYESGALYLPHRFTLALPLSVLLLCTVPPSSVDLPTTTQAT